MFWDSHTYYLYLEYGRIGTAVERDYNMYLFMKRVKNGFVVIIEGCHC
jgi:hypothetical protein